MLSIAKSYYPHFFVIFHIISNQKTDSGPRCRKLPMACQQLIGL